MNWEALRKINKAVFDMQDAMCDYGEGAEGYYNFKETVKEAVADIVKVLEIKADDLYNTQSNGKTD